MTGRVIAGGGEGAAHGALGAEAADGPDGDGRGRGDEAAWGRELLKGPDGSENPEDLPSIPDADETFPKGGAEAGRGVF